MTQAAQQTVASAKAALAAAEQDLKQSQVETAKEQLREVRAEGHKTAKQIRGLDNRVRRLDAEITLLQGDLAAFNRAIELHESARPDVADFPSDEELANHEAELQRLIADRDALAGSLRTKQMERSRPVLEVLQLNNRLNGLRYTQQNLERKVRGEPIAGGWEGGIGVPS